MDELAQIIQEWANGTMSLDTVIDELNAMQMEPDIRAILIEEMLETEPTDIILH